VLVATNILAWRSGIVNPSLLWLTQDWAAGWLPVGFAILGALFLISTLTQFFAPAEQATIPLVVERRHAVG